MRANVTVDKNDLLKVLLLVIDNDNLSASKAGLEQRRNNREEIQKELLYMLNLTKEEAEELYMSHRQTEEENKKNKINLEEAIETIHIALTSYCEDNISSDTKQKNQLDRAWAKVLKEIKREKNIN